MDTHSIEIRALVKRLAENPFQRLSNDELAALTVWLSSIGRSSGGPPVSRDTSKNNPNAFIVHDRDTVQNARVAARYNETRRQFAAFDISQGRNNLSPLDCALNWLQAKLRETGTDCASIPRHQFHDYLLANGLTVWPIVEACMKLEWISLGEPTSPNYSILPPVLLTRFGSVEEGDNAAPPASVDDRAAEEKIKRLVGELGVREPLRSTPQNVEPTVRERNILEALGDGEMTGAELAKKAGYPFNGRFREVLSTMKKRGMLLPGTSGRKYRRGTAG